MVTNAFDQAAYWIIRHSQHPGEPKTIGNLNHSDETNIRGRLRIIDTAKHFLDIFKSKDVLDIGCGFGDLCEATLAFGVHYTGIDISPIAIGFANTRYPQQVFLAENIIEWRPSRQYDLIFCVYTLSFIVNDSDWRGLLLKLSSALRQGGSIIIIDDIRSARSRPASHVVARTFLDYEEVSREVNLQFTQLSPGGSYEDHSYPKGLIAAIVARRVAVSRNDAPVTPIAKDLSPSSGLEVAELLQAVQASLAPALIPVNADLGRTPKPTMLVLSWDMSHNPAARGYILADMAQDYFDVEFSGPIFSQFGSSIWGPLQEQDAVKITTFEGGELAAFFREAVEIVRQNNPSIVYVSKPRLPSFLLGVLFKLIRGTPFILDIDDHELSFCADATPLGLDSALALATTQPAAAKMPFADVWTRLTETLIDFADAVTVSNPALQAKFGGILVRHARSEHLFSMDPAIRKRVRAEFSLLDTDIAIVFVGTPRPHKGIFRIAEALERIDNPNLVFIVVGSIRDARVKKVFDKYKKARIKFFPDQPWKRLSELVSMADMVSILQDIESPITEFQIPAKLTDAIAMGIPVIVTPVAPLADLIAQGIVIPIENDDALDRALANAVSYDALDKRFKVRLRSAFVSEFSYGINSARIRMTAEIAKSSPDIRRVAEMREFVRRLAEFLDLKESEIADIIGIVKKRKVESNIKCNKKDIVFFWKQNDSDIYGRRHDMMIKYLAEREDIRKNLVFDRSLSVSELDRNIDIGDSSNLQQGNMVYVNTIKRILKMNDSSKISRRTFLYREGQPYSSDSD